MTFDVDGVRFGCALGMETHYPEIFTEYERLEVDCVLFSTTGDTPSAAPGFAAEVLGHSASNAYWIGYAAHAPQSIVPLQESLHRTVNGKHCARQTVQSRSPLRILQLTRIIRPDRGDEKRVLSFTALIR